MWKFITQRFAKLGCFFAIAMMTIAAAAITKVVLGWFHYDETQREALGNSIGEYVGKGLLGIVVLLGFIVMGRQLFAELRGKRPHLPVPPPPRVTAMRRDIHEFNSNQKYDDKDT